VHIRKTVGQFRKVAFKSKIYWPDLSAGVAGSVQKRKNAAAGLPVGGSPALPGLLTCSLAAFAGDRFTTCEY
jgi:hypothetical protein